MAAEDARAFWAKVKQDQEFRNRLAAAASDLELDQLIRDAGFVFTAEELQIGLAEWRAMPAAGRELEEKELEAVAGGSIAGPGGFGFVFRSGLELLNTSFDKPALNLSFKG